MAPQTRSSSKEAEAISVQDKVPGAWAAWSAAPRSRPAGAAGGPASPPRRLTRLRCRGCKRLRRGSARCFHPPPAAATHTAALLPLPASPADYRRGSPIAFKYVKRGYHVLCSHGLKMALMPLAAMGLVSQLVQLLHREAEWRAVWPSSIACSTLWYLVHQDSERRVAW